MPLARSAARQTANAVRRDIKAIPDIFGGMINKAENADLAANNLTSSDLLAASALTTLELRLQAAVATQRMDLADVKGWGLWLMVDVGQLDPVGSFCRTDAHHIQRQNARPVGQLEAKRR